MMLFFKNLFKKPAQKDILIFCGAGISAESGLDTFRDKNGLWSQHDLEQVCNYKTWKKYKKQVFDFYDERKKEILAATPNAAHTALAQLQKRYPEQVKIFTSNIDDLLERAGCQNVCHVHGDIFHMVCTECAHTFDIGKNAFSNYTTCSECLSEDIKPAIVFFNEQAYRYKELNLAFESSGKVIDNKIVPNIKLFIGTSFKVIKLDTLKPKRGQSIVLEKNPNIIGSEPDFFLVLRGLATEQIDKAINQIEQWLKS